MFSLYISYFLSPLSQGGRVPAYTPMTDGEDRPAVSRVNKAHADSKLDGV